ncbi:hypothetical protein EYF80_050290 [Liparis tanakae]|uniref:Uncharacterized protein n=1 Tax=Liparis tanakae TaxID=230148 RepID=A0A4Z2FFK6_9TELE|nr:hypothetical protein EYF80_050290 [Liparis tanakae]
MVSSLGANFFSTSSFSRRSIMGFRMACSFCTCEPETRGALKPHHWVTAGCRLQVHELEALQQLAVLVLEAVGLVDDDAAPLDGVELGAASQDHLEGGDERLEPVVASHHAALKSTDETNGRIGS